LHRVLTCLLDKLRRCRRKVRLRFWSWPKRRRSANRSCYGEGSPPSLIAVFAGNGWPSSVPTHLNARRIRADLAALDGADEVEALRAPQTLDEIFPARSAAGLCHCRARGLKMKRGGGRLALVPGYSQRGLMKISKFEILRVDVDEKLFPSGRARRDDGASEKNLPAPRRSNLKLCDLKVGSRPLFPESGLTQGR